MTCSENIQNTLSEIHKIYLRKRFIKHVKISKINFLK